MIHKLATLVIACILLGILIFPAAVEKMPIGSNEKPVPTLQIQLRDQRPWWVGDLITVLGILVSATIIIYQLGRQHKSSLYIQKENYREQLRLQIYEEFSRALKEASNKTIAATMYAFALPTNLKIFCDQRQGGFNPPPVSSRAMDFNKKYDEAAKAVVELIRLIEKYEIVGPELNIFKMALSVADHDLRKAHTPLFTYLLQILPMDLVAPTGQISVMNVIQPTEKQLADLGLLVGAYMKAQGDLGGYLYDLNVEIQNAFLSKLFGRSVPRRMPLDPNIKVITTEPAEMEKLKRYFEDETDWGKEKRKTEEAVKSALTKS